MDKYKVGDIITWRQNNRIIARIEEVSNLHYQYVFISHKNTILSNSLTGYTKRQIEIDTELYNKGNNNMLKEIVSDSKQFVKEHRSVFYTLAVVFLVDHFLLNGSLRERLKAMVEKLLCKAEAKLDKVS